MVAAFSCVFVNSGVGFFAFSLFVRPLQEDLGWTRGGIMAAYTIYSLLSGAASPFIGRVIDRYAASKVISVGAFISGLGFVLLSLMSNLWHFYGSYIVIAVGMTAMGTIPTTMVVSNWFQKRRGTVIGIMSTGMGAGGVVLTPLIGGYLIPGFSWRIAYLVLAVLTWLMVIPLALLVIKTRPADIGLYPDGVADPEVVVEAKTVLTTPGGLTLKMALATPAFWLIALSSLASGFSLVGILMSQVPYLEDIGFPVAIAAGTLGGVSLVSLGGRVGFGWLCDRIPAKYACCIGIGIQVASLIVLMNVQSTSSLAIIWLYVIILGLCVGSWLPVMAMLVSDNFGFVSYGAIFGIIMFVQSIGVALGPIVAGYMYDSMNTYYWAFITFLILYAVSALSVLAVRRPKSFL
ncbi:MAG: MFS transporter [Chloroflexi bacterium]|nr:MFS transporter [Chloroflexota bacterium]MBI2980020.1 MFS transporter [Chloroflexota bacterium]